jgi:S1-C subfamily serine protease
MRGRRHTRVAIGPAAIAALAGLAAVVLASCGGNSKPSSAASAKTTTAKAKVQRVLSLPELVAHVRSGIVRVEVTTCDERGIGTGFLLGPRLVATVEHVVDGATRITFKQNGRVVGHGTVVGSDTARDLALVRSDRPIRGYAFRFASRAPRLGETVTAIGFPLGLPLTVTRGTVSGLDRTIPIDGVDRKRLVQTDAAVNPGNSGGPLIIPSGAVVGLVDLGSSQLNGIAFAVSALVARPLLAAWQVAPQPIARPSCASSSSQQAAPAPAPPTQTAASQTQVYQGQAFSIVYPSTFLVTAAEEDKGGYYDTTIEGPTNSAFLIRVDESVPAAASSVDGASAPVINTLRREAGYREISLDHENFQGWDALRWEFEVPENGVLLHKVDLFFIDGSGNGWAILTQAPASVYSSVATAYDQLRASFTDTGG